MKPAWPGLVLARCLFFCAARRRVLSGNARRAGKIAGAPASERPDLGRNGQAHMLIWHYPGAAKSTIALLVPLAPDGDGDGDADGVTKVFGAAFFGQPFPITDAFKDLIVNEVVLNI